MTDHPIVPFASLGENIDVNQRQRINRAADAMLRLAKDITGNDARLIALAACHVIGAAIGRSVMRLDVGFISRLAMHIPAYVNAYSQDGPGNRLSEDT